MGRRKKNHLELTGDPVSGYQLRGHIMGERVRMQSLDLAKLEGIKNAKEHAYAQLVANGARTMALRQTWLSEAQLRDAEAAAERAKSHSLLDCVIAAEKVMPKVDRVKCDEACDAWIAELRQRGRYQRTIKKNEARVKAFLKASDEPCYLTDITPEMSRAWVFRGTQGYTPLTDATVIQAWFRWCQRRRMLATLPFDIDMRDLAERSRTVEKPRILTPAECERLVKAAREQSGGRLLPYVALTLWCFLRHAEAVRTTPESIKLNLREPVVEVNPRKRGTPSFRQVAIPANVLPLLRSAVERNELQAVRRAGRKGKKSRVPGIWWDKRAWEKVRKAAKLGDWQENLLRHTGISYRYQQTGDMKLVCREAGNSDETSFRHYLNLPNEGDSAQFYAIAVSAW